MGAEQADGVGLVHAVADLLYQNMTPRHRPVTVIAALDRQRASVVATLAEWRGKSFIGNLPPAVNVPRARSGHGDGARI